MLLHDAEGNATGVCSIGEDLTAVQTQAARISRLADLEREAIFGAITQLNGDKLMAARLLGIGKTTLYRKLKEYGIFLPSRN